MQGPSQPGPVLWNDFFVLVDTVRQSEQRLQLLAATDSIAVESNTSETKREEQALTFRNRACVPVVHQLSEQGFRSLERGGMRA